MTYRLLDLFSGIGGFSLGLERSGNFNTVAFCEIEPFCRSVLRKHWPKVPIYEDVSKLSGEKLKSDGISVDAICGGFPCQDISTAGKGYGLSGQRSGLWYEYHRLINEIMPKIAIIENVSALRSRGLEQVLRSLAEIGYDAEWHCIPASAVGAPHQRDRIWIVAYPNCTQCEGSGISSRVFSKDAYISRSRWWETEPAVDRVAYGLPNQSHRLRALGNAVVPQIPEMIGRSIK